MAAEDVADLEDSMILDELTDNFEFSDDDRTQFRLLIAEIAILLPYYASWMELMSRSKPTDLGEFQECSSADQPCRCIERIFNLCNFYIHWFNRNFDKKLKPKTEFRIALTDVLSSLMHYSQISLMDDIHHLQTKHIPSIDSKLPFSNFSRMSGPFAEEEEDDDDDNDNDNENDFTQNNPFLWFPDGRNVFEYFEDEVGDCEAADCGIYDRTFRSRYDPQFQRARAKSYGVSDKLAANVVTKMQEIQYQKSLDALHVLLWHSSEKYYASGLEDSEEHRKLIRLGGEKRNYQYAGSNRNKNKKRGLFRAQSVRML
jgi:hypothetical protein